MKLATAKRVEVVSAEPMFAVIPPKQKGTYRLLYARTDVGHMSEAYARLAFEVHQADGVVLKPYLGRDSVTPFTKYKGKEVFIQLMDPDSALGSLTVVESGLPLWQHISNMDWGSNE